MTPGAHGAKLAAPSSRHEKRDPGSDEVNEKLALVLLVRTGGPCVIVVRGAAVSIVQVWLVAALVLPAVSMARTANVCVPSGSGPTECGLWHSCHGPLSRRHSNVAPGSLLNSNVPLDASSIVTSGAVVSGSEVSIVHAWLAASPVLPAGSVARTSKLCGPSPSGPT